MAKELLHDIFGPLLSHEELRGKRVAEIGAGAGSLTTELLAAGAKHVIALEPSDAFPELVNHLQGQHHLADCLNCSGALLTAQEDLDVVFCSNLSHCFPEHEPVLRSAYEGLKLGGRIVIWLIGKTELEVMQLLRGAGFADIHLHRNGPRIGAIGTKPYNGVVTRSSSAAA
jgi:precorrin-6B methylase 2